MLKSIAGLPTNISETSLFRIDKCAAAFNRANGLCRGVPDRALDIDLRITLYEPDNNQSEACISA